MLSRVGDELDLTRLLELQRVLGSSMPELLGNLMTDMDRAVDDIDAGLAAGDSKAVALGAHAARNSALMLDARPMLAELAEIESAARAGNLRVAGDGVVRLHSSWPAVRARLERELPAG